ncbi:MAG: MBL fold metallo-hydrolase [Gammaproteobacteria bacterium]|nr:MBL fold metallo-hydrolase [Gammaproteobacteria bacterium]
MPRRYGIIVFVVTSLCTTVSCAAQTTACPPAAGVALQVLGSGGPVADDARASSGYIVWVDGKSRVLIDAGGGTFLRFGEAAARFVDLDFVGLSHFHTDHSVDFAGLLKSGYFTDRERALRVAGPDGAGPFPGLQTYLNSLLNADSGAYGYLAGYLDGSRGLAKLEPIEVVADDAEAVTVFSGEASPVSIAAMRVPHGIVPALGFRVRAGAATIVFASDQNGSEPAFVDFARNATILVMHMPIPEGATGGALQLHAPPSRIAAIASEAGAATLVLSHFMARSLRDLEDNVATVRAGYDGELVVASDLDCLLVRD